MNVTQQDPLIGSIVGDRFRVDELFSTGGMSRSYKGFDKEENRDVLVRVLNSQKRSDSNAVKRYEIAANAAKKMSHQAIAPLVGSGYLPTGVPYLVYEFITGHNVRDEIAGAGKIAPQRVRDIMIVVAGALHHAHVNGVLHRNMKPGNILIKNTDEKQLSVVLTGFGIARRIPTATSNLLSIAQTKKVVGSPTYMSPESFSSPDVDARSDVYSFGCVMYEMLTGRPPFMGDSFLTTAARHSYAAPTAINELSPDVPPYMESLVVACMRKSPDARYQSMQDVTEDLEKRECRFGTLKFTDDVQVAERAEQKPVSMWAKVGVVVAILTLAASLWFSAMYRPPAERPAATRVVTERGGLSIGDTGRMESDGLDILLSGDYRAASRCFLAALENPSHPAKSKDQCRIELAYAQVKLGNFETAAQHLKNTTPVRNNPLYGVVLLRLEETYNEAGELSHANYYDSIAKYYGYDVLPTDSEVEEYIKSRLNTLRQ